jgi:hypothetical protein
VVRSFPNAESCLRLIRALAVEMHENWLEAHRYLNMDDLCEHKNEAPAHGGVNRPTCPVDNAARCPQGPTTATIIQFAEDSGHNSIPGSRPPGDGLRRPTWALKPRDSGMFRECPVSRQQQRLGGGGNRAGRTASAAPEGNRRRPCAARRRGHSVGMDVAALPGRLRQDLDDRLPEPGVVIRDHELDAGQAAPAQPQQKLAPARTALAVGKLDRQNAAASIPANADRQQHRPAVNDTGFPDPLVTGNPRSGRDRLRPAARRRTRPSFGRAWR